MPHGAIDNDRLFDTRDDGNGDAREHVAYRNQAEQILAARHMQVEQQQVDLVVFFQCGNGRIQIGRLVDHRIRVMLLDNSQQRIPEQRVIVCHMKMVHRHFTSFAGKQCVCKPTIVTQPVTASVIEYSQKPTVASRITRMLLFHPWARN